MPECTHPPTRRLRGPAAILAPEEASRYYADIGRTSNARRIVLSGEEVEALANAYAFLRRLAAKHPDKLLRNLTGE